MPEEVAELAELQVLGVEAQRAVSAARAEAQSLGHPRIGTEHLLLGILRHEGSDAARLLHESGASRAAVWSKVREAKRPSLGTSEPAADEGTPRAARALRRSVRFSRQRKTGEVTPEDLLIGVLDVEGTAGQVLRSLGVDLDDLRAALDGHPVAARVAPDEGAPMAGPTCPGCGAALTGGLTHHRLPSTGPTGVSHVVVHACPACGCAIGLSQA